VAYPFYDGFAKAKIFFQDPCQPFFGDFSGWYGVFAQFPKLPLLGVVFFKFPQVCAEHPTDGWSQELVSCVLHVNDVSPPLPSFSCDLFIPWYHRLNEKSGLAVSHFDI